MALRMRRREFLAAAGAGLAAPVVIPAFALGEDGAVAPRDRLGLGVIGAGGRGSGTWRAFQGKAVALAVCDPWADRRDKFAQGAGNGCKAYADFREILARTDIDFVAVFTPEHWHVPISLAAVRADKDVFCEKPISLTLREGRLLSDACRERKRIFQHGTQHRGESTFTQACEAVRAGRIGKVTAIKVGGPGGSGGGGTQEIPVPPQLDYEMWLGPAAKIPYVGQAGHLGLWNHRSDYSPGYISAWGIHYIDLAQWGAGRDDTGPVEIEGRGVRAQGGFNDCLVTWHVTMRYADGMALSYSSDNKPHPHGVRFEGTEGWIFVKRGGLDAEPKSLLEELKTRKPATSIYQNLLDCIRTRRQTTCNAEIAHRSTSVCHLANIACLTGRKLAWDPKAERFKDDPEADKLLFREPRAPWRL
jgi:predicted dehydrogenase